MVINYDNKLQVIEATWPEVAITPLDTFLAKTPNTMYLGRLLPEYTNLISEAKAFAIKQVGIPYDVNYLMNNDKYYCSELLYDAFKYANEDQEFFKLYPMTYKSKKTKEYFPEWLDYFEKLGQEVPENLPGCNPAGMSLSKKITIIEAILQ